MKWMYDDALFMKENGRYKGCLCLLLCLIDALSSRYSSNTQGNRHRYCSYLEEKLSEIGIDVSYRVEEKDDLIHISEIIYEYFRCYIVHEADDRTNINYEIQLSFGKIRNSVFNSNVLIDRQHEQIIIKAEWLINILSDVAKLGLPA